MKQEQNVGQLMSAEEVAFVGGAFGPYEGGNPGGTVEDKTPAGDNPFGD